MSTDRPVLAYLDKGGAIWRRMEDGKLIMLIMPVDAVEMASRPEVVLECFGPLLELTGAALIEDGPSTVIMEDPSAPRLPTVPEATVFGGAPGEKLLAFVDQNGTVWRRQDPGERWLGGAQYENQAALAAARHEGQLLLAEQRILKELDKIQTDGSKYVECGRRDAAGRWCEWRKTVFLPTLGDVVAMALDHGRETHGE